MPENSEEKDIFQAAQTAPDTSAPQADYGEETIRTLDWKEHIRLRPGMYIGKLGDGTDSDDGIYVLLKEVLDNAIDEFMMGYGRQVDVTLDPDTGTVSVRDYGRGVPLGKIVDVASRMNTAPNMIPRYSRNR